MTGRRSALAAGFEALRQGRLIVLLALVTALLGITAAVPLWPALDSAFARTLAGDHILRNHPTFAPTDVFDFLREQSAAVAAARQAALWSALLGVFFQMLLAGGIVAALGRSGRFAWREFFEGCRRNLWHNAKCFSIFVFLLALAPGIWITAAFAVGRKLFEEAAPWSAARLGYRVGAAAVALLLFGALSLLYDFARSARRANPSVGAWRAFGVARCTLLAAPFRALGLFLFWLFFGAGVVVALFCLEWGGTATSAAGIAVHTALQAAVILARSGIRVGTWGSLLALFDERTSEQPLDAAEREQRVSLAQAPV